MMRLVDVDIGKMVLIAYLCICAFQDFKTKYIDLRVCFAFIFIASVLYAYLGITGHKLDYWEILLGLIPACIIFLISKLTRSGIGMGDGYFFMGLGIGMGIGMIMEVILYSVLIMAFTSLILVLYYLLSNQSGKGKRIPMIPFVLLPGILLILR